MIIVRKAGNIALHRHAFKAEDVRSLEEVRVTWEKQGEQDCVQVNFYGGSYLLVPDEDRDMLHRLDSALMLGDNSDFS